MVHGEKEEQGEIKETVQKEIVYFEERPDSFYNSQSI